MTGSYLRSLAERTLETTPRLRPILPALYGHAVVAPQPLVDPSETRPPWKVKQPIAPVAHNDDRTKRSPSTPIVDSSPASEREPSLRESSAPSAPAAHNLVSDSVWRPREQLEKSIVSDEPRTSIERRIVEFVEVERSFAARDDPDLVVPPARYSASTTPRLDASKRTRLQSRFVEPAQTVSDSDLKQPEKDISPGPVHVHIGRIDLRTVQPPAAAPPARRPSEPPKRYLEEYIRARESGLR